MISMQDMLLPAVSVLTLLIQGTKALTTDNQLEALTFNQHLMSDEPLRPECWNFTHGNPRKMEIYSPSYPNSYPNNVECVLKLEGPIGYEVHLDFREKFKIEKSDECKYDFLEIRDGPYGYSPLIDRFCGNEFPPYIRSTSRFLWIRFKSDKNVGKDGFVALYSFVKKLDFNPKEEETKVCRRTIKDPGTDGMLSSDVFPLINDSYYKSVSCTWDISLPAHKKIRISEISLGFIKSGNCDVNFVEIYQRTTSVNDRYTKLCSGSLSEFRSRSNRVFIRIYGSNLYRKPIVNLMYTVFNEGTCDEDEQLSCDGMCISKSLQCDGRNNCPDKTDESTCNAGTDSEESGGGFDLYIIIVAAVGGLVFTVFIICICLTCRYKRDKRRKEKEAKKQQERLKDSGIELATSPSANTTLTSKKGGGLPPSYYSLPRKGGGSAKDYHRNSLTSSIQTPSEGEYNDQHSDPGNYKRYMMTDQTFVDDETSPCPSLYNQGPVLTTIIERHDIPPQTNIDGTYSWSGYGWKPQHGMDTRSPVGSPPTLSENLAKLAQYTSPKNFPQFPEPKYYNPESKYEMYPDPRYMIGKDYKMKYGGSGQEPEVSSPEQHRHKQQKLKSQHPDITRDLEVT